MELWKYSWFQTFTMWCNKWDWWRTYMWGRSISFEDYVRNFGEVLRESFFPFIIKDVKSYSVFNLRCGYIPSEKATPSPQVWVVPMGDRGYRYGIGKWVLADLRVWNPWWTKFCNAMFFLQLAVSLKYHIPIPYVSMVIKVAPWYFQFGLGWGPEANGTAILCGKFRFVNERTSSEQTWNPSDVSDYSEGTI